MSHVFISYSRKDSDFVYAFEARLSRIYKTWIDKKDISGSSRFTNEIEQSIRSAKAFIILLSPDAIISDYILSEMLLAIDLKLPIFPYIYKPCDVPLQLRPYNWIQHSDPDAFGKVIDALSKYAAEARHHPGTAIDLKQIGNADTTFEQAASTTPYVLRDLPLELDGKALIGLPICFTRYHAAYLVGRADDSLEYQANVQLGFQLTGSFPGNDFSQGIGNHFITPKRPNFKLRLFLVRTLLAPNLTNYGYDPALPEEWGDAITITDKSLENLYSSKPQSLQIFIQGPSIFLYQLGVRHKGFYQTELYHYDRFAKPKAAYFPVM